MIEPRTDRTLAAAKRAAIYSNGDDMVGMWFDVARDMRDLAYNLEREINELKEQRENWRVSSVCRELRAENDALKTENTSLRRQAAVLMGQIHDVLGYGMPNELDKTKMGVL
jgi:FtsZ-binding cell division protein ZapB